MKLFRFPLAATVLALALSVPAFAGDMPCGITSTPPSQTAVASETETTPTSETVNETTAIDPVTETALHLMVSVLSLF